MHASEAANRHKQNRALFSEERDAVFAVSRSEEDFCRLPHALVAIAVYLPVAGACCAGACWPCGAGVCCPLAGAVGTVVLGMLVITSLGS